QSIHSFQYLNTWWRYNQQRQQVVESHRLTHNCQPAEHDLLQRGESGELFAEQVGNAAKNDRASGEKLADLASKEVGNGLSHDLEGQRVACIYFDEPRPILGSADQLVLLQQLLAGRGIQAREA